MIPSMLKLKRWHRIGVIISMIWIVGAAYQERTKQVDSAARHATVIGRHCLDTGGERANCMAQQDRAHSAALKPDWANVAFVAFAPVMVGWLLALVGRGAFRWIRAGEP